jgi:hypothetical protein
MKLLDRFGRLAAAVGCAAILAGCANLEAVRDFTASSARLTAYKDITERYLTSADRQLAEIPATAAFAVPRAKLLERQQATAAQKDSLIKLHNVTTGYMAALAKLAGEDTFDISGGIDQVAGAISAVPDVGINADHVAAYAGIVQKVASWALAAKQAKDVKEIVKAHGMSMDKLLEAMEVATVSYRGVLHNEREAIDSYQEGRVAAWKEVLPAETGTANTRRELVLAVSRRSYAVLAKEEADALKAAEDAAEGVTVVRKGHAEMLANVDRLDDKQVVALLKKAAADLKDVRSNLKKL